MSFFRVKAILFFCIIATGLTAQKGLIKKANKLYKSNQYNGAIELYEQALQDNSNLSASTKLANCYRMTNQTIKAEEWYEKIVANDKSKPITYFHYAEALMGNGKYDLAKDWFLKYNEKEPNNQDAVRMAYACDKIKTLVPYFTNVKLDFFAHNSEADDASPLPINNGIAFTSDRPQSGINPLKQKSGWTGRDYQKIYFSQINEDGSYDKPDNFSKKINEINRHCGPISFTKDKKTIIFTRTGLTPGKNNTYNIQLYSAESDDGIRWKRVKILSFCREDKNYMHPAISPDGSKLFFVSDKSGGLGGTDIYMVERKGSDWGRPKNLGPVINTPSNEAFPFFHESGKLFFSSKGHLSFGGYDILFSNLKEDDSWQKPVNIGKPINSSHDDLSIYLDETSETGYFASSREGGDDDIYIFEILEGINADLESVDFEDIANEGPELEGIKNPLGNQSPRSIEESNSPITTQEVDERPIKNIESKIRNTENLEEVREEENTNFVEAPETNTPVESKIIKETINTSPSQKASDIAKEIEPPVINQSTSDHLLKIEEKTELLDLAPADEATVTEELMIPESKEESIVVEEKVKEVVTVPSSEKPLLDQDPEMTNTISKQQKEKKSSVVNLMIPKKEAVDEEKEASLEPSVAIKNTQNDSSPIDKSAVEKIATETTSQDIQEEISHETSIKIDAPSNEVLIEKENTSILDREPIESNSPVLIGGENSALSDQPMELSQLAELLQAGQAIPAQGFVIQGINYPKGSYLLPPVNTRSLAAVIDLMQSHPSLKVEIGSHTSAIGNDIDNHNLSRKRAMSIKAFLIYKGIEMDRIEAKGYGETQLTNHCTNGVNCPVKEHEINNRVEVKVID